MKKIFPLIVLAAAFSVSAPKAEAKSFVSLIATVPDTLFHVVTVGTDTLEYVGGKIGTGTAKIDYYADDAVEYFHNLAHPTAAVTAEKLAKKQAKAAEKKASK